jgi:hypothetical protein
LRAKGATKKRRVWKEKWSRSCALFRPQEYPITLKSQINKYTSIYLLKNKTIDEKI